MSYILDALRKSEQQRLAGGAPSLNSGQPAAHDTAAPQRNWLVLAAILLAINAGAVGWWLAARPAPAHTPASPALAATPAQPQAAAPTARSVPTPSSTPAEGAAPPPGATAHVEPPVPARSAQPPLAPTQPDPTSAGNPRRPESPADAASVPPAANPPLPKPATQTSLPAVAARPPSASPPEPEEAAAPAPRSGIMLFADLPPSIRKALPPLQIGGYIEGAGTDAMLIVDDRLVHEGDELGGGVRVLKISPDGAVFSFRNYRFRR
jgi:general secretion pathway protein B